MTTRHGITLIPSLDHLSDTDLGGEWLVPIPGRVKLSAILKLSRVKEMTDG